MATYSQKRNLFILYEYSAVFTDFFCGYLSDTRLKQGGRVGGGGGVSVDVNQELKLFEPRIEAI